MQSPQSRGGGMGVLVSDHLPPVPLGVGSGLCFQHCQRGQLGPSPEECGRGRQSSFSCWCLVHPFARVPSAEIQVQTLRFEAVCLCLQESGTDGRRAIGCSSGGKDSGKEGCLFVWAKLETLDT